MGRLRILSGNGVWQILEKYAFTKIRQHGSHVVMQCQTETGTITMSLPDHSELKIGTLSSIIRQSRLPREVVEVCNKLLGFLEDSQWHQEPLNAHSLHSLGLADKP